jgi:hypothetical protein
VKIFRRPTDPIEVVLRRLSKSLRWFRPSLADAPTPASQFGHLAQHRLCPAIEQGDAAPALTALAITEEALAAADLDHEPGGKLDHTLTLDLIEVLSNWCSWPETPSNVVTAIDSGMGPLTRARWNSVREQGNVVADWIHDGGASDRTGETPAVHRRDDGRRRCRPRQVRDVHRSGHVVGDRPVTLTRDLRFLPRVCRIEGPLFVVRVRAAGWSLELGVVRCRST